MSCKLGHRKFYKNPLPLDKQRKTDSILSYIRHIPSDPHMTCLWLKVLPTRVKQLGTP